MTSYQTAFPFAETAIKQDNQDYRSKLLDLLSGDLDFQQENGNHPTHQLHSFPAKFPPQLPRKFITTLTQPGDVVLDPMSGSGTTVLEALLHGRNGVGFDIDPLALLICQSKVTLYNADEVKLTAQIILREASTFVEENPTALTKQLEAKWDAKTLEFINYWFAPQTQLELLALINEIEKVKDESIKQFFRLMFSSTIITKSGGVSLAFDLAHTRPHKAKVVKSPTGEIIVGTENETARTKILTKVLRSPIVEFNKRVQQNLRALLAVESSDVRASIQYGRAENMPLEDSTVDLIVTSPPYVSNAIDYMRAHKFSLVWLGFSIEELTEKRKQYIGGEIKTGAELESFPTDVTATISEITTLDKKKAIALKRYYSEMTHTLSEMYRVLKPGKAAIVVVGNSILRGKDTKVPSSLASIGESLGFQVPMIGVRKIDRNRRMLPAGMETNRDSQIQQRMHEEYVIGFYKP